VTALELNGNAAPGFVFKATQGDKAVVGDYRPDENGGNGRQCYIHFHMLNS